jgi:hypothetical protein
MGPNKTRAQLQAEITELCKVQTESYSQASFVGWTREAEEAHRMCSDRLSALYRQLAALDGQGSS